MNAEMAQQCCPINNDLLDANGLVSMFLAHEVDIESWFESQWRMIRPMCYSSVDLRYSGYKCAPIDTNVFPAGFNNLDQYDQKLSQEAFAQMLHHAVPGAQRVALLVESHTRNMNYFKNIAALLSIISGSGFQGCCITLDNQSRSISLDDGRLIHLSSAQSCGGRLVTDEFDPCVLLLNNDLSSGIPEQLVGLKQPILPMMNMGWSCRRKSTHFDCYQRRSKVLASIVGIDPWLIAPLSLRSVQTDFSAPGGSANLQDQASDMLRQIQKKYREHHIEASPFLVLKADSGTYGMGVMSLSDPSILASLNRKQRNKMAKSKGGNTVDQVIIQEGVPTIETHGSEQSYAEPVIYTIGQAVVGGFYRINDRRGPRQNLNAPGMFFSPINFCLKNSPARYYLFQVLARLAMLSAADERQALGEV